MKNINAKVKQLRKSRGATQEDFGKILGLQRSTYAYKESHGIFTVADLIALSEELDVNIGYFTDGLENLGPYNIKEFHQEPMILHSSEFKLQKEPDDPIDIITANETKLIKKFRTLSSEEKQKLLKYVESLKSSEV